MLIQLLYFIVFCTLIVKVIVDNTKGRCKSKRRLDGKTIIVTGSNAGIGLETVRGLAWRGGRIIMACRNTIAAMKVKNEIVEETGNTNIVVRKLDISSLQSVREFADEINKSEEKIDILIHNAGVDTLPGESADGIKITWATNLYGPFLLTHLLVDLVKRAPAGRIVFVSSVCAFPGMTSDFTTLDNRGHMSYKYMEDDYRSTKYAICLMSNELARRLRKTNVKVNSLHPGLILTNLIKVRPVYYFFTKMTSFIITRSAEEGAQTTLYVAISEECDQTSGKFFFDCFGINVFNGSKDVENGNNLWVKCVKTVQLTEKDPKIEPITTTSL